MIKKIMVSSIVAIVMVFFFSFFAYADRTPPEPTQMEIINTPLSVEIIKDDLQEIPFQTVGAGTFDDLSYGQATFNVPNDGILVIDNFTVLIQPFGNGKGAWVQITTQLNSTIVQHFYPVSFLATAFGTEDIFYSGQKVHLFADPGTIANFDVFLTDTATGSFNFSITGFIKPTTSSP